MFDLISGTIDRPLRDPAPGSKVTTVAVHAVVLTLVVVIPLLRVTNVLPDMQTMMAFAVESPRSASAAAPPGTGRAQSPGRSSNPCRSRQDNWRCSSKCRPTVKTEATTGTAGRGGVEGGVEGGVAGGVLGGIVGGIISSAPPPPPAPPVVPIRVGGQINTPALLHRVEPDLPEACRSCARNWHGDSRGGRRRRWMRRVGQMLRSRHLLLDNAAIAAIRQWRYKPLILNGIPTPFVLTVTFTFSVR